MSKDRNINMFSIIAPHELPSMIKSLLGTVVKLIALKTKANEPHPLPMRLKIVCDLQRAL